MKCPDCKGEAGSWNAVLWHGPGGGEWLECWCDDGHLSLKSWIGYWLTILGEKML